MSQVLKGGASGTGGMQMGKPMMGQGAGLGAGSITGLGSQSPASPHNNMLSSPTAGMPGVLPGNILHGHTQKSVSMATISVGGSGPMATPIIGANLNGSGSQQGVSMSGQHQPQQPQGPNQGEQMPPGAASHSPQAANGAILLSNLANTKEKTPMCLINELARFNKIQHTYTLTDEQGPAHKKVFYVKLKLGEEEYPANGPSIKKAQHAAAAIALEATQYKHPPPKPPKNPTMGDVITEDMSGNPSITPTVELNALAMKLGQPAHYRPLEPARNNFYPPNLNFRGMYNQRYHQPRYPRTFYVSLKVGQREFIGEGNTRQMARHNAADKALKVLSVLPITCEEAAKGIQDRPPKENQDSDEEDDDQDPLKSEISLVHEIALKRNLHVNFEVTKESGPPHMKTFVTRCTCGTHGTEGEGNSKKLSKKRAAEKMMEELQKLPTVNSPPSKTKKNPNKKKNTRNIIKADPDYGVGINPISRLIQIQQAKKEKEPVYMLLAEKGMPRRKEFVIQVSVGEQMCTGVGPNKKLAKRNAAEAMLQMLGYSRPSPQPSKPSIKTEGTPGLSPNSDKKVTFLETEAPVTSRQLVPGVLLMPDAGRGFGAGTPGLYSQHANMGRQQGYISDPMAVKYSPQTTAAIAKELLDTGCSPTAEAINKQGAKNVMGHHVVRPKQQLLYLAEVLGFQVEFTDFPKSGKKSDYLSLVSLSTNPPQVSHGGGNTLEASHDMAALTALKALTTSGLDVMGNNEDLASGDGIHMKMKLERELQEL